MSFLKGSVGTRSNRATWVQSVRVIDENGDDVDISAATITLAVERQGETTAAFSVTVGSGITVVSPVFTFTFSETNMRTLDPGIHKVGCTITISDVVSQLLIGTVTIVDGIVD